MTMDNEIVKLIILSHKRWDNVETLKSFANCALCVTESQAHLYKDHNPGVELIVHPDSVVGLSPKIRWVYERYPNVMMLDDDLNAMVRNYVDKSFDLPRRVDMDTAYDLVQSMAFTAGELGAKMFGLINTARPLDYTSQDPFKLSGFVQGGYLGFLEGFEMVLPDECVSACDYFLSAINAHYHRLTLIDRRFAVTSKEGTFTSKGGTADYRTMQTEKEDYLMLRRYFGDAITRKKSSRLRTLSHSFERGLKIPF